MSRSSKAMSDSGTDEDDTVENPDPEADTVAEASASFNAESDSNLVHDSLSESADNATEGNDNANAELNRNSENSSQAVANVATVNASEGTVNVKSVSENPEGFEEVSCGSASGVQVIENAELKRTHNDSMTEGDQNLFQEQSGDASDIVQSNNNNIRVAGSGLCFGTRNEFAAEDEQYCPSLTNRAGCIDAFEPESNFDHPERVVSEHEGEGAGAEDGIAQEQIATHRTESSVHLEEYGSTEYGAGSHLDYNSNNQNRNSRDDVETEGACASGQDDFIKPESELEECMNVNTSEKEKEPTESDQEIIVEEAGNVLNERIQDLECHEVPVACVTININQSGLNLTDNDILEVGAERSAPEDELNSIKDISKSSGESYQPECDQSEVDQVESGSSHAVHVSTESPGPSVNFQSVKLGDLNQELANIETEDSKGSKSCERKNPENCDKNSNDSEKHFEGQEARQQGDSDVMDQMGCAAFTKESGAIPKHKKPVDTKEQKTVSKKSELRTSEVAGDARNVEIDSEEELLSELDATLQNCSSEGVNFQTNAISQDDKNHQEDSSCENCLKNHLQCSFKVSKHVGSQANIPGLRDLKRQFHQAKQVLLDRECEISRLKEDLADHRLRCETLTSERDSLKKEVNQLKSHNSDDLYIPQLKELEYTIAQQTNEIRGLKDKLSSHDAAAKRAIATLQQEMKLRVEQIQKQLDEANKEKDSMVVKYAQAEHKNLEFQKQAERAENKLKEMEKERDGFLVKMKAVKDQRSKLAADLEAKNTEVSNIQRELEKQRETAASTDIRVKWAQNKLKAELDAHKETKTQLEKMTAKLKEAKEETQQIRKDCQAIIKTYQESEEVKSNSLDKELKLKESELLEREVQKNNFELAQVKTQLELEQVRTELRESQSKFSALSEKLSKVEAEKEQSAVTATKYADVIQKQKKEIQELREKVDSLVQVKADFNRAQELIKNLDSDIAELKMANKELTADMEACRHRETENLDLTAKLSRKNAELQSENTTLGNKVLGLTGELQAVKMESQDSETKLKELADALAEEKKLRQEETQSLNTKLAGKCKAVEDLTRKLDDEKDEIKTLKRKHTNNIKDLTRQLQQVRRRLENYEASTNGDKDTISMGSRTSSNGSLNTVNVSEQTITQVVQPTSASYQNTVRHHSTEQEYPVITEQVEVDKQTLIERIVKLQKGLARQNEKLEFMEDHISQLIDEIQKKNKIIQSYVMKEEGGTMTSEFRDRAKAEISKKQSIMGSVYSSHSNDGTMTLDLSLEINRKLQAVLEDTILKNMTLKESLDTLGQEIARLSQENRQLQLQLQGKSKSAKSSTTRR